MRKINITLLIGLLVEVVSAISLDVRVYDRHHLPPMLRELVLHRNWVREKRLVPTVITLPVRVLDVEPHHLKRSKESK